MLTGLPIIFFRLRLTTFIELHLKREKFTLIHNFYLVVSLKFPTFLC